MRASTRKVRESLRTHGIFGLVALCLRLPLVPILRSDFGVRLSRAYNGWIFDRRFHVHTSGWIRQPNPTQPNPTQPNPTPGMGDGRAGLGNPYDGSNPAHFKRIIQNLDIRYEDYTFVDLGSGKGRVLLLASAFPFRSVTGVEWSQELHEIAQRNIDIYKGPRTSKEVRSFCMDAAELPIPSGKSVLYLFNPFGDEVMGRVLENVRRSFEGEPREIILVYMNPRCKRLFDEASFLKRTADKGWFAVYRTLPGQFTKAGAVANPAAEAMQVSC
jgi:SAM-dependent methyltransferase